MAVLGHELFVLPDAERVEQAMVDAAARKGGFADGSAYLTFAQFLGLFSSAQPIARRPCSPLIGKIVIASAAEKLPDNPFGSFVHEPGFARAALELIFQLKGGLLDPDGFAQAINSLPPLRRKRAQYLARLYESYERRMAALRLADREDRIKVALARLNEPSLPSALAGVARVNWVGIYDFSPLRFELLLAFARQCDRHQIALRCELPASGNPAIDAPVDAVLAELERRGESLRCTEVMKWDAVREERPFAVLAGSLFSTAECIPASQQEARLGAFSAPGPREEARQLARRALRSIEAGVPPEQIAIVYRDLREEAEWVVEALEELGIPSHHRRGAPLGSTSVARTAFELPLVVEENFPAHRIAKLVASRYAPAVSMSAPDAPGTLLAWASIRDDEMGGERGRGAYEARLLALRAQLEQRGSTSPAREASLLLERCRALFPRLRRMSASAPFAELLGQWWTCASELGLPDSLRRAEPRSDEATFIGRAVLRSMARDQSAGESLQRMVTELEEAFKLMPSSSHPIGRRTFHRWLLDVAADFNLSPEATRAGAVRVLDARELVNRRFQHVLIGGLTEDRFPGRQEPDSLFSAEEKLAINQRVGRPVFRLFVGERDQRVSWRLGEDRLLFYLALTAAQGEVTLSYPRTSSRGEEAMPSSFLKELERRSGREVEVVLSSPVPGVRQIACEQELRERASLEAAIRTDLRIEEPDPAGKALADRVRAEDWFEQARALAAIEEERLRSFSDPMRPAEAFSGWVGAADLQSALAELLRFGPDRPLTASALSKFGNCGFQGFLSYGLRLESVDEADEELNARERGSFWHKMMEVLFPKLGASGLLNRPIEEIPAKIIEDSLNEAALSVEQGGRVGHPLLWKLSRDRAVAMSRRLLQKDHRGLPFDGLSPVRAELHFGSPEAPEGWREVRIPGNGKEPEVFFEGRIDRLDASASGMGVLDYKSSQVDQGKRTMEKLLRTEFQLPLYLYAAARGAAPAQKLDGAWLSLKDGNAAYLSRLLADHGGQTIGDLLSTDPEVRERIEKSGGINLANAVHALLRSLRLGNFPVRPSDCRFCSYRAVCRISERRWYENNHG